MKLPYLKIWDNTPVVVDITDGIDENGSPAVVSTYTGNCCYTEKTRIIFNAEGKKVQLSGFLTIGEDIAPNLATIDGYVTINGLKRVIHSSGRQRNPDGTVNHTRLELI